MILANILEWETLICKAEEILSREAYQEVEHPLLFSFQHRKWIERMWIETSLVSEK